MVTAHVQYVTVAVVWVCMHAKKNSDVNNNWQRKRKI